MSEVDDFFSEVPSLVQNGRYAIPDPTTGAPKTWQRASNYASPLADGYGLTRHRLRNVLRGLMARPDIAAVITTTPSELGATSADLDRWVAELESAAKDGEAANIGTAVHNVLETVDDVAVAGMPADALSDKLPDGWEHVVSGYRKALADNNLRPYAIEQTVLNVPLGAAGRFDRIYAEADGSLVIGDIKTTRKLEYAIHEYAVQFEVYASATHYVSKVNPGVLKPIVEQVRRDYAVLVQVNPDDGTTMVYRVPLAPARWAAGLAQQVRDYRSLKGLLLPYTPPTHEVGSAQVHEVTMSLPDSAKVLRREDIEGPAEPDIRDTLVYGNETRTHVVGTPEAPIAAAVQADLPVEQVERVAEATEVTELAKLPKPELQRMARALGWTDVAHHRKWLAEKIVALQHLRDGTDPDDTPAAATVNPAPAEPGAGPVPAHLLGSDEEPLRPPGWEAALHVKHRISGATSLAELHTVQKDVVERHGDQAWTDEYAALARERLESLARSADDDIVAEIMSVGTSQQLATIWDRVTLGGTAQSRWTTTLDSAAQRRMAELKAATPPPPPNPFAGS